MHHLSDEQDDDPNVIASTSAEINGENSNFNRIEAENCDAGHSDTDDSINDDESLLNNCISIGMQAKNIEPGEFQKSLTIYPLYFINVRFFHTIFNRY